MLTILVEYLAAARKTRPRGAGVGLGGQPPCVTGGSSRRGRRACVRARWLHRAPWLPGWRGSLTAWPNAAGLLAWAGWLAWADAAAVDGVHGGG